MPYFAAVHRFFANKVGHGVDDLVQETFLACVESKTRLRDGASFRAFIFGVARRRLFRKWRDENRGAGAIDFGLQSIADLMPSPSTHLRVAQNEERLLQALRGLPVDLQIALELYYWEELTAVELSAALEIPEGTVRSRLRRGRQQLKERLAETENPPADLEAEVRSARNVVSPSQTS